MATMKDIRLVYNISGSDYLQYTLDGAGSLTSGVDLLKQRLTKMMLTAKGSNIFTRNYGSEISKFFGAVAHPGQVEDLKEAFPVYLVKLVDDLKAEQEQAELDGAVLTRAEKVLDISLESIVYDYVVGGWIISLSITTEAHQIIPVTLPA